ncbi:hypothetical protein AHAS_Ahas11G0138300 [Arachis hypogaea]
MYGPSMQDVTKRWNHGLKASIGLIRRGKESGIRVDQAQVMEDWIQLYQLDTYQAQSVRCDAKSLEDTLIKRVMDLRSFPCLFFSNHWCNARGCNEWPDYRFLWPEKGNENVNSILHNRMVSPLLLKGYGIGVISCDYIETLQSIPKTRLLDLFQSKHVQFVMIGVVLMVSTICWN